MAEPRTIPDKPCRFPHVAAIGVAGWDRTIVLDRYPPPGQQSNVLAEFAGPGGTTANAAVALARLGCRVALRAQIGMDEHGRLVREELERAEVATDWLISDGTQPTSMAIVLVSREPVERTFLWKQGASLARGDRIDVAALFGHELVYLDVYDMPLRRFLLDLPAHTLPTTRLLGSLTSIARSVPGDGFDMLLRHDVIVGSAGELVEITGTADLPSAIELTRERMKGENLRAAAISLGAEGALAFTVDRIWRAAAFRTEVVDTTGAGDAFAAGVALGMACRWEWDVTIRFGNAVAACSISAWGAQSGLPNWDEAFEQMRADIVH